jgi:uncharacterized protein involved in exopolysaccharide biosynthesis
MTTSLVEERIQVITQLVMTLENLSRLRDKYRLYPEENLSTREALELIRENVFVEPISVSRGRRQVATIAFTVSYENEDPSLAQRVAADLVDLFLRENVEVRTRRAAETTEFLAQEAEKLRRRMEEIEQQIAGYKQENVDSLPENQSLNMGRLDRERIVLAEIEREMRSTKEQTSFYEAELETLKSSTALATPSGNSNVLTPAEELLKLQNELTAKEAEFTDLHPDVKSLKLQITHFRAKIESEGTRDEVRLALTAADLELERLRGRYTDNHPEVKAQLEYIETLEQRVALLPKTQASVIETKSPAYREMQARILVMEARLATLAQQRDRAVAMVSDLERRIERTPEIERGFKMLSRDYENAVAKFQEVKNKQLEAQMAQQLEVDEKAERFSLVEPPLKPENPVKPNRLKIVMIGLFLAVGSGVALVLVLELADKGIRNQAQLTRLLKEPPLMTIPYLVTAMDERRRKHHKLWGLAAAAGIVAGLVIGVHLLYQPLDQLLIRALHLLGWG